ncbi:MAG: CBS domain-containing protein [Rhodospirillaceae bacterium]
MRQQKKLSDIMNPNKFVCLGAEDSAVVAARRMMERQVGAIIVTDGGKLCGIVTERDINFRLVAIGRDPATTSVADIMTRNPTAMAPDIAVVDALDAMQKFGYRHMPIVKNGTVIGVISLRDILIEVRKSLEQTIQDSDAFIIGSSTSH